jgi:choline dehydrogenase-like flavoprotein
MFIRKTEIAVVGSGPGGAVTAALLAEAGRDVTLFEEGQGLNLDSFPALSPMEMQNKYRSGGLTVAMGRPQLPYAEGRVLGGGSEINSALFHRTPSETLQLWSSEFALRESSEAEMRIHFEACERDLSVGVDASQVIAPSLKLADGAHALGWRSIEAPRCSKDGRKQSMSETFIPRAVRAGCRIDSGTKVIRVERDTQGWTLHTDKGPCHAETVFVSGGAIQTPSLLLRSGIKRNVGRSLQLHPTVKLTARFAETVNVSDPKVPGCQVTEFSPRMSFGCSSSTPALLAMELSAHAGMSRQIDNHWSEMWTYYAMVTGSGKGGVSLVPGFRDPLVRYQVAPADLRDLAIGLKRLARLLFAAGAVELYPSVEGWGPAHNIDESESWPEILPPDRARLMSVHLFSSCPAGENKRRCATDSFGKLHDSSGLYLADASLLCTAPGVNPQGSIMAFARRNVLRFLGQE